jgi:hypothetical protein
VTLTFNRPDRLNALSTPIMEGLLEAATVEQALIRSGSPRPAKVIQSQGRIGVAETRKYGLATDEDWGSSPRLMAGKVRLRYNETWLVARHGYRTPAQVRADQCRLDQNTTADLKLAA